MIIFGCAILELFKASISREHVCGIRALLNNYLVSSSS
jgi:hypothetical protein